MSLIEAQTFTSAADMIKTSRAIRDRLWKPKNGISDKPRKRFIDVEFTEQKETSRDYGGLNPEFVRNAEAKARAQNAINETEWRKKKAEEARAFKEKMRLIAIAEKELMQINAEQVKKANAEAAIAAYSAWEWDRRPTLKKQIMVLCGIYGISYQDVVGPARSKPILEYRFQFIAKIAKENPAKSMVEIGKAFGGRDHTSIRNALMKMGCPERGYHEQVQA